MTTLRVCFVGDSLLLGTGDDDFLGWPGRVMQREREAGHELTMYNLGIRGDTSSMIASRWRAECEARLPAENWCALVFSFGCNDMAMDDGQLRITVEESVATARQMMAEAKAWLPTLWIGPMPVNDDDMPFSSAPGRARYLSSSRNAVLGDMYEDLAAELGIPYLDLFTPLAASSDWPKYYVKGDGVHPMRAGHAMVADLVIGWDGWRKWFE
ncbi:MAG: GDSL-type esterase/lipase family protein [Proteobacteria bacterium]|nr:GDSL-type esterase/lipase family protein [Pseudomonadota bacterium]